MAELTAKLFRDYFGGNWVARIDKNGDFQREIVFNWPEAFEKYSSLGTEAGLIVPPFGGALDNTSQVAVAGWRPDVRRWIHTWHNEYGGFGELQWTSQEEVEGITILHGFIHECKQEGDDPTEHVIKCEIFDGNNFKYSIRSFRKGLTEVVARRLKTATELKKLMEKQASVQATEPDIFNKEKMDNNMKTTNDMEKQKNESISCACSKPDLYEEWLKQNEND